MAIPALFRQYKWRHTNGTWVSLFQLVPPMWMAIPNPRSAFGNGGTHAYRWWQWRYMLAASKNGGINVKIRPPLQLVSKQTQLRKLFLKKTLYSKFAVIPQIEAITRLVTNRNSLCTVLGNYIKLILGLKAFGLYFVVYNFFNHSRTCSMLVLLWHLTHRSHFLYFVSGLQCHLTDRGHLCTVLRLQLLLGVCLHFHFIWLLSI